MFHLYLLLAFIFVCWRFVLPLPCSRTVRMLLATALLLAANCHLLQRWIFGTMFSPEMPRAAVIAAGWAFCAFVLLLCLVIVLDLLLLTIKMLPGLRSPGRHLAARLRYSMAAAALCLSACGVYTAVQVPQVKRVELAVRGLPPALDGFRLVQLSDLHISRLFQAAWVSQVVQRSNALQPDMVLITGDLIDGSTSARAADVAPLAGLRARHGVFASLGNHEYYFDAKRWTATFEQLGLQVVANAHRSVPVPGGAITIAAITDPVASQFGMPGPDIALALEGALPEAPIILLSHQPIHAVAHAAQGVGVQLSGHTHGGMIKGLDLLAGLANDGFVSGLYKVDGMQLYVSNGSGLWNGFPIRLGVPSEMTELTLRRAR